MNTTTYEGLIVRPFQQSDLPLLGELYENIMQCEDTVFWWVGEPANWSNVYGAFANGKMLAKGQVDIVSTITSGFVSEHYHAIYLNLKTVVECQSHDEVLNPLYLSLLARAKQLKATLPTTYPTMLCVGNYATETENNAFFQNKQYRYLNSQFHMIHHFVSPLPDILLPEELEFQHWSISTLAEQQQYLEIDKSIWPEAPIGLEQLNENQQQPLWTSMVVRHQGQPIGGLMVWKEDDEGVIEDVWVHPHWRKRGIARYLLTQALHYIQHHHLSAATLTVLTNNTNALSLYQSAGFEIEKEEVRYGILLD
ncbi:GNAT family N-acetyltransferase [Paenibacillus sp. WLX1005]|uniref:GNAT family N-acetyltransferase n=1 Tax=Paenibacillus sp. WLX1005 TaxID=3243766 RepID=UPI0039845FBF